MGCDSFFALIVEGNELCFLLLFLSLASPIVVPCLDCASIRLLVYPFLAGGMMAFCGLDYDLAFQCLAMAWTYQCCDLLYWVSCRRPADVTWETLIFSTVFQ